MSKVIKCTECNQSGGTIPKYYLDDVIEMMHENCVVQNMQRYMDRKDALK